MLIKESHGVITKNGIQWSDLSNVIVDYIYDVKDGLNGDPFYEPDEKYTIDTHNIISYYKFKYGSLPSGLIPKWIYKFEIVLDNTIKLNGYFNRLDAKLIDNKLNFEICLNDISDKTPDNLSDTLSHEFRHAYTRYLELSKQIQIKDTKSNLIYADSLKSFHGKSYSIIKSIKNDVIILKPDVYTNPNMLTYAILKSIYMTDIDELNSFLQEFSHQMNRVIQNNRKDIIRSINKANKLKSNFKNLSQPDKWKSNIINDLPVSCYDSNIYARYVAFRSFWEGITNVDDDLATEVLNGLKTQINAVLQHPLNTEITEYTGDATNTLSALKNVLLMKLNRIIRKMEKLFHVMIINIDDSLSKNHINENVDLDNFDFNGNIDNSDNIKLGTHKLTSNDANNKMASYLVNILTKAFEEHGIFSPSRSYKENNFVKVNDNTIEYYSKSYSGNDGNIHHTIKVISGDTIDIDDKFHRSNLGTGDTFNLWIPELLDLKKYYNIDVRINKFAYNSIFGGLMPFIIYADKYTLEKKYYPKELVYRGKEMKTLIVQGKNPDLTEVYNYVHDHSNSSAILFAHDTKENPLPLRIMEHYVKLLPNFEHTVHEHKFDEIYYDTAIMDKIYEDIDKSGCLELLNVSHRALESLTHKNLNLELKHRHKLEKQANRKLPAVNKKHTLEDRIQEWLSYNLVKTAILYVRARLPYMTDLFIEERNARRLGNTLGIYTYIVDVPTSFLADVCDRARHEFNLDPIEIIKLGEYAYQYVLNRQFL